MMSTSDTDWFLPVSVATVLGLLLAVKIPELAIIVRTFRPFLSFLAIAIWLAIRLLHIGSPAWDSSLFHVLVLSLHQLKENVLDLAGSSQSIISVIQWLWRMLEDILGIILLIGTHRLIYCAYHYTVAEWKNLVVQNICDFAIHNIPPISSALNKYKDKMGPELDELLKKNKNRVITSHLPLEGRPTGNIIAELESFAKTENATIAEGKVSGTVYPADQSHTDLMNKVYALYSWSNPLHGGIWPKLNQCEAEIIAMTANLMHGNDRVVGTCSSGGTESIILAIKAHRNYYAKRRGISHPELICCSSAHAAVDKACDMLGIRKIAVPSDSKTFTLSAKAVQKYITSNTLLIYASAPSYPQGVIDPIEELSAVAQRFDIGLHVDACLGGFVLPFAAKLGYDIPKFSFDCPGVTSMSVDTHKFGYASKGTSVVLYRDKELRHAQYFCYSKWTGGMYATATIAGSRPGALLAATWAALVSIGESGYCERVQSIIKASEKMVEGISQIPGIYIMGEQRPTMVVCFASDEMDIYRVGGMMSKRGWHLNDLQHPPCMHICITLNVVPMVQQFLDDLSESVHEVRKEGASAKKKGSAAMYGSVGGIPEGPVNQILEIYTDLTLTP
mmetsp:Transcript_29804/g.54574  ORF Transcript_29804/g.54574 Transcript_29804/m.54574 type:complete len:617 (-) Transcript_29804:2399-4249(-)